ncbi:MAG: CPBP family intramembrane metalloprotease [Corallococcus sp.]|nr:CPBP family intramembrane metalloprotease [Corallococcus sp.]MCM1359022.1 CPBP family intramembrane metalloprotease [Corallococcus sp.]MCM1395011.1 CPBP family intramembrane metalloprotease [Corallococcus sp.]
MRTSYNKNDLGKSFGLTVLVMLVLQITLSLAFSKFYDAETKQYVDWAYWTLQTVYALILGCVPFIYAKLSKTDLLQACKVKEKPPVTHVAWGCLATVFLISFMLPVNEWFLDLFELMGLKRPQTSMPMNLPVSALVPLMLVVACIVPSFTEEFLFRGTISASVKDNKNKLASLAICGGLFALFHLSAAQTVHQFVLGAFLALLYFRSGSIWTTVCVHFFNNVLAVVLTFTVDAQIFVGEYAWIFALVGALGFAGSVVGYLFTTKSRWNESVEDEQASVKTDNASLIILIVSSAACLALWVAGLFQ